MIVYSCRDVSAKLPESERAFIGEIEVEHKGELDLSELKTIMKEKWNTGGKSG